MRRFGITQSRLPPGLMIQIMHIPAMPLASYAIHVAPSIEELRKAWYKLEINQATYTEAVHELA